VLILCVSVFSNELNKIYSNIQSSLIDCANEIDKYCNDNNWVNEIKLYVNKWSIKLVLEWKNSGTFELDEQLNKIRGWIENIKNGMEKIIITKNKLLKVDTMPIETLLVTKLDSIYIEICECVLKEINKDSLSFISTMNKTLKVS
jgi:hypothetical protein